MFDWFPWDVAMPAIAFNILSAIIIWLGKKIVSKLTEGTLLQRLALLIWNLIAIGAFTTGIYLSIYFTVYSSNNPDNPFLFLIALVFIALIIGIVYLLFQSVMLDSDEIKAQIGRYIILDPDEKLKGKIEHYIITDPDERLKTKFQHEITMREFDKRMRDTGEQ